MMDSTFRERQRELCLLSSFITEQEEWLNNWLNGLGWTKESLQATTGSPELLQCPFNPHHYIPSPSMEDHKKKCCYAVVLGTNIHSIDEDEFTSLTADTSFLYRNSGVESVQIGKSVANAVKKLVKETPNVQHRSHDSHMMLEQFSSLEEPEASPQEISSFKPPQFISFIKSWKVIPCDFAPVDHFSLNLSKIKGWLFKNLPEKHAHSYVLGGEISMVEGIMACLAPPGNLRTKRTTNLAPNILMNKLRPLLGINARSLVLDLWKFIHISQAQKQYGLSDGFVAEIAPMSAAKIKEMKRIETQQEEELPSIAKLIEDITKCDDVQTDEHESLPLPPNMTQHLSTSERRVLYDYVVEITSRQAFLQLDPGLYRDDMAVLKAKLKAEGKLEASLAKREVSEKEVDTRGKTYLQLLKERRDYKRRRQKYRAKNVHITRRTPTEIFRTVIKNRMEELRASLVEDDERETPGNQLDDTVERETPGNQLDDTVERETPGNQLEKTQSRTAQSTEENRSGSKRGRSKNRELEHDSERKSKKRHRSRSHKSRKRHRRSRSKDRRSQSRDRRSRSRDRRSRSRDGRLQSKDRSHKHKKHRHKSRSKR